MIMTSRGLHLWADVLQAAVDARCRHFSRVYVLNETDSTQDAAVRLGAGMGDVITTGRQTAGRGRLGRAWADTADQGVAATFVLETNPMPRRAASCGDAGHSVQAPGTLASHEEHGTTPSVVPSGLAIAAAVGVARAVETLIGRTVGIKWPNDIVVDDRKLAGILIERWADHLLLGIGINVTQSAWPSDLAPTAVSLRQCGASCDRLAVLETLLTALDEVLTEPDTTLRQAFAERDVLQGTVARFRSDGREVAGRVMAIDPLAGLRVRTADGETVTLPAATTRVLNCEFWE